MARVGLTIIDGRVGNILIIGSVGRTIIASVGRTIIDGTVGFIRLDGSGVGAMIGSLGRASVMRASGVADGRMMAGNMGVLVDKRVGLGSGVRVGGG